MKTLIFLFKSAKLSKNLAVERPLILIILLADILEVLKLKSESDLY
jgi:hypothetical protein